jgi:hypothetical protein
VSTALEPSILEGKKLFFLFFKCDVSYYPPHPKTSLPLFCFPLSGFGELIDYICFLGYLKTQYQLLNSHRRDRRTCVVVGWKANSSGRRTHSASNLHRYGDGNADEAVTTRDSAYKFWSQDLKGIGQTGR